jgi:integrase
MTLEPKPGGFLVRLRYGRDAQGKELRARFLLATKDEATANDRKARMQVSADALSRLQHPQSGEFLIEMGRVAADEKAFSALERVVGKLVSEAGSVPPAGPASGPTTFRDVAELWCSGKLTEQFPDHRLLPKKDKDSRDEDLQIVSTFFPVLSNKPMSGITIDDIDAARRLIPRGLHHNTRRKYAIRLRTVMRLAESPLRLVERAPLVEVPKRQASNLFGFLYPQEESLLLAYIEIPLGYRVLYGFLTRNGCRIGEMCQLTWDHIDLETGDIWIDKRWTKTKRARRWVLEADVLEALEAYHRACGLPKGTALVFPGRGGKRLTVGAVRKRFTKDLIAAGVTRSTILRGADGIEPLRVHDLRATFITLALRMGRSLKWIMTRTGHEDFATLKVYDRLVEDANEHHLPAWLSPMAAAIPEFRPRRQGGPSLGQTPEKAAFIGQNLRPQGTDDLGETEGKHREKAPSVTPETRLPTTSGPAEFQGVGQPGPGSSDVVESVPSTDVGVGQGSEPVESALAAGLQAAIGAQQWELAQSIVQELGERRRARVSPAVTSLADARRKRDGEGGK